jgi:TatD DNase family protein
MNFFDSHCHLQDNRYGKDLPEVLRRAEKAGIKYMICCATSEKDWEEVALLAEKYKNIVPSFGIHPWFLETLSDNWIDNLEGYLQRIHSGVGECGLDFAIKTHSANVQEDVFKKQLYIAKKLKRPVNIHCRRAWNRLVPILKEVGHLPAGGVIHSYSGSHEQVNELESFGLYLSFSGSITRPNSKKGPRAIQIVSRERLLIETDSPDILPSGIVEPGERMLNEPAFIKVIAERMAGILGTSIQEVADMTYANTMNLFKGIIS